MKFNINFEGEISREKLKDFAQYIIPYIRDFSYSDEGKNYISAWIRKHTEYENDEDYPYYDEEDEDDY